jgi:hypothetical protein
LMSPNNGNKYSSLEICILLAILAITFLITLYPHLGYPYPIHHDEWMHMTYTEAVARSNSMTYVDPFYGLSNINGYKDSMESGLYVLLSLVQKATGISFLDIFVYSPAFLFCLTVLAVYVLARRQGFGLEAAFFTSLLPTSIGLLGPVFMVPLSLALFLIPLLLFLAFNGRQSGSYILLFILICFLILLHPPSAAIALIMVVPFMIIILKKDLRHSIIVALSLVAPFLLLFIYLVASSFNLLALLSISPGAYIRFPDIISGIGFVVIFFGFLGFVSLFIKFGADRWGILFGFVALLMVLLLFIRFNLGADVIYQRGLVYLQLLLSIIAGAGLAWLGSLTVPVRFVKLKILSDNAGKFLTIIFAGIILITIVPSRLNADYYHMIDSSDYKSFGWIGKNLGREYKLALLDPWEATSFSAVAQKYTVRRIFQQREPIDNSIDSFLKNGCQDSTVLRDTGVDIIYNRYDCNNADLNKVKDRVYVLNSTNDNMLQNAGFERLASNPTYPWKQEFQDCKPEYLYAENGINGSHAIEIKLKDNESYGPAPYAIWFEEVPVKAGATYQIGGNIRTENVAQSSGVQILAYWVGDNWEAKEYTRIMEPITGTKGWEFYDGYIKAPAQANHCRIICFIAAGPGMAWFDDMIFYEK